MPLYEYTCSGCGDGFTLLQSIHTRAGETVCPACGGKDVVRQLSAFAPSVAAGDPMPPAGGCGQPGGACGGGMCGL